MAHDDGAYLGGIRTLQQVRGRCIVDDSGCWHLRSARGAPMPRGKVHRIWLHGLGSTSATRAVWLLAHPGKGVPSGHLVVRTCASYDCVAPAHLRPMSSGAHKRMQHRAGRWLVGARRAAWERLLAARRKLAPEQVAEVLRSPLSATQLARQFGVSTETVAAVRRGDSYRHAAAPSVWSWRP